MSKKIADTVKPSMFTCQNCRKKVEVPFLAMPGYGWWFNDKRYCSYSCMRVAEKARLAQLEAKNPYARDMRTNPRAYRQRIQTFGRLVKFIAFREDGLNLRDAALKAGFPSERSATGARKKYEYSEDYCAWQADQERSLEDVR